MWIVPPARQTDESKPVQALWLYGGVWLPLSHSCLTSRSDVPIILTLCTVTLAFILRLGAFLKCRSLTLPRQHPGLVE